MDTKQYAEELLKAAGVSDDTVKQAVMNVLTHEAASKKLSDDVLRQSDYSRNMDDLRKQKQETTDYYQSLLKWQAEEAPKVTAATTKLQTYEALYGPLNGGQQQQQQTVHQVSDFMSKKDFEAELTKRDQARDSQVINLLKDGMRLASQHAVEFREALDTDALEKIATEKKLTLKQAYDELVAPRRQTFLDEKRKKEIADAKAEGAREFASTHKIPVDSGPKEYHPIFDRDTTKMVEQGKDGRLTRNGERALQAGFVEEWEKAGAGTSGT